jgi:CHAT domain-containing protein/tetratricopeptide (TPR) repeat protein
VTSEGETVDEEGNPIKGETREFIITREIELKPGDIFRKQTAEKDIERVSNLGIFEHVILGLEPAPDDPNTAIVIVNIVEGSKGSIAFGGGFSTARGFDLTVGYKNNNLKGINQKLSSALIFGELNFSIQASLSNIGITSKSSTLDSLQTAGISALNTQVAFISKFTERIEKNNNYEDNNSKLEEFSEALITLFDTVNSDREKSLIVQKSSENFLEALKIAEQQNKYAEAALTLNNLGNFYLNYQEYKLAIDTYQEAQRRFQKLDSLGLEVLMLLLLATAYRGNGQPNQALESYYEALNIVKQLRYETNWKKILGQAYSTLNAEWHLDSIDVEHSNSQLPLIFSLLELSILVDIGTTYSILGDDQQAIYVLNSPQLVATTKRISQRFDQLLNTIITLIESEINFNKVEIEKISTQLQMAFSALIKSVPDLFAFLVFRSVYSDINDLNSANFYKLETEKEFNKIKNIIINSVDLVVRKPEIFEIDDTQILEILQESTPLLVLIRQKLNNPKQTISETDLAKALDSGINILNILLDYPEDSEEIQNINDFRPLLQSFALLIVNWTVNFGETKDTDNYRDIIELIQQMRTEWPSNSSALAELNTYFQEKFNLSLDNFEWLTGWMFLIEGNSYIKIGEYQKAVVAYQSAINLLPQGYDFIDKLFNKSGSESNDLVKLAQSVLDTQLKDAYLKAAETYLELKQPQPSQAKSYYIEALLLTQNLEKISFTTINNKEIAGIYYGIARADLALENFEKAQELIESAIELHKNYLPKLILSGGISSTRVNIQYGYGVANQGSISGGLDISSNNPWTNNPWEDDEDKDKYFWIEKTNSEEIERKAVESYFTDRQKYFDLYVNILVQRHKKNPAQGFDILALEVSERARINSLDILQDLDSSTNLSSEKRRLFQRKLLLNQPISLKDIQQQVLEPNTLLLEYFLGEEKSYLWVISKDKPLQMFELPPRAKIEAKAQEFYDLLTSPRGRVRPQTTAKAGQELSEMILSPVAPQLQKQRLLIVADGFLQYLPFSVLPNLTPYAIPYYAKSLEGEFAPHLKPLLLDHEIVNLPSASALVALRQDRPNRSKPTEELAIFANPVFNHKDERVKKVTVERQFQPLAVKDLEKVDILYGALPETAEELSEIEALIPKSDRKTFQGYDANLTNVLNGELGKFRIVHFATHGIFNSKAPERSGVVLSSIDEQGKLQSGLLSPSVAFNQMNLSGTELVILSGCKTGFGRGYTIREGLTGLTGGFIAAGTDRIVVSLWRVGDRATRELMTRFYQRMLNKDHPMPAAQALRAAQISMWEDSYWQTPYYWAAFTIQGEWR